MHNLHVFSLDTLAARCAATVEYSDIGRGLIDARTIAQAISAHLPNATHGGFYAFNNVDNTFTTFDTFADFSFQCIEAGTFGYTYDVHNAVIYVLDCI
jgi:hypothetical protein